MALSTHDLLLGLLAVVTFGLAYVGASVGLVLGQFRVPLLVWWLGSPIAGAATSLAISTAGALIGAFGHALGRRVRPRLLLTVGLPSGLVAFAAARHAGGLDPEWLEAAIGLVLVVSGAVLLRRELAGEGGDEERKPAGRAAVVVEVAIGAVLGALTAVSGLLLGTLRLPLLVRLTDTPTRVVVGSNMAIGALTGVLAGAATLLEGHIDLVAFVVLAPATLLGAALGARATGAMKRETLARLIAGMLVAVGLYMLARGLYLALA